MTTRKGHINDVYRQRFKAIKIILTMLELMIYMMYSKCADQLSMGKSETVDTVAGQ